MDEMRTISHTDHMAHGDHRDAEFHHHHSHAASSRHPGHHHVLTVEDLTVAFDAYDPGAGFWQAGRVRQEVLHGLTLSVHEGEILAVVGASGSGKTVLADALLGLYEPNAEVTGRIWFDGELQDAESLAALRGRSIALVPQRVTYLDPRMRAGEQVRGVARGATRAERAGDRHTRVERQRELFEAYGLGPDVERMYPYELSGGMARRVLLMCALMEGPRLIVADEPTSGLDLERAVHALDDLRAFADTGGSVLLITHDLELSLRVADRVAVFKDGTIVEETAAANFASPALLTDPFSRALVAALPERWGVDAGPSAECGVLGPQGASEGGSGAQGASGGVSGAYGASEGDTGVLLRAADLRFAYPGARELFDGLSLEVGAGERVAIAAPSGAGKTTLCKLLAGYLTPASGVIEVSGEGTSGAVRVAGVLMSGASEVPTGARSVQLIAQHPEQAFDPRMRMRASLAEAGNVEGARGRMLRERFGVRDEWLERLPHELSGGELMRCCMVRALMTSPRVLICDESTAMLDLVTQAELWRVICELQVREGFGVVFTSHVPVLVRRLATRVVEL